MSSPKITIAAYGNILVTSAERFETFKETIANWQEELQIEIFIRVRGSYANKVEEYCSQLNNVLCKTDSEFIQWRNQAYFDLLELEYEYIMIFLEDHQILCNNFNFRTIVESLNEEKIDIFQYSWFQHQARLRKYMESKFHQRRANVLSASINLENFREISKIDNTYFVSLTSIFRRSILIRLLKSRRPLLRKYDSRGPFDFEKSPRMKFYLPIMFGLPVSEFALCVDDEMGIAGSSAISRGLSNLPLTQRGVNHYSKLSPRFWLSKYRVQSFPKTSKFSTASSSNVKVQLSKLLNFFNVIPNTFEFLVFELVDKWRFLRLRKKFSNK